MSASHVYRGVQTSQPRTPKARTYQCMVCKNNDVDGNNGRIGIMKVGKKYKKGPVHISCA